MIDNSGGWLTAVAFMLGIAVTILYSRLAGPLGLLDHPGGRKDHSDPVPLVGGLAIFTTLLPLAWATGVATRANYFLFALSIVIAVGLWDDVKEIRPRVKFAVQIVACSLMIWGGGVQLTSVGDLLGWRIIGLSTLSVPVTIFAVVGVVNSINMIDGMDGLAGSVALVALAWYAAVADAAGLDVLFVITVILCGALAAFLAFNLRLPWRTRASVFLGDAGSLMIGFALGWLAIDLTQGRARTFPPIAALWVVLLPLADCVSLMTRRLSSGRSPFVADRQHIHHYLLARGWSPTQTLVLLTFLSTGFGAVGFFGWRLNVPEAYLFWPFFFGYFIYHFWIKSAWRRLEELTGSASSIAKERASTASAS